MQTTLPLDDPNDVNDKDEVDRHDGDDGDAEEPDAGARVHPTPSIGEEESSLTFRKLASCNRTRREMAEKEQKKRKLRGRPPARFGPQYNDPQEKKFGPFYRGFSNKEKKKCTTRQEKCFTCGAFYQNSRLCIFFLFVKFAV